MIMNSEHNLRSGVNIRKKLEEFSLDMGSETGKGCLRILGPSGCGRSMALESIAGIVGPDSGRIVIQYTQDETAGGRVLYDLSLKVNQKPQVRRVGYLFQNYVLFPNMTVEQNIAAGLSATGGRLSKARKCQPLMVSEEEDKVRKMVSQFRLEGLERWYPSQLSGEQQQRVTLTRILAYEPEVLLLDGPFSATDTYLGEGLRLELAKVTLGYDGVAVVVTHDRDKTYQLCDNLLLLDRGRVLSGRRTRDIFQEPVIHQAVRLTGYKNTSRIKRLGDRRIKAPDQGGLELMTDRKVNDTATAVDTRAHDLEPLSSEEADTWKQAQNGSLVRVGTPSISGMPFEWYTTLDNGLQWGKEKDVHTHNTAGLVPAWLRVEPSALLLLTGNLE